MKNDLHWAAEATKSSRIAILEISVNRDSSHSLIKVQKTQLRRSRRMVGFDDGIPRPQEKKTEMAQGSSQAEVRSW